MADHCDHCGTEQGPFARVMFGLGDRTEPLCRDCAQDIYDTRKHEEE